ATLPPRDAVAPDLPSFPPRRSSDLVTVEAGLGARQIEYVDGRDENDAILRLGGGWLWTISETSEFSQRLVIETGDNNTYSESTTDRKSTRLNSSHVKISYAVFCLKE